MNLVGFLLPKIRIRASLYVVNSKEFRNQHFRQNSPILNCQDVLRITFNDNNRNEGATSFFLWAGTKIQQNRVLLLSSSPDVVKPRRNAFVLIVSEIILKPRDN